MNADMKIFYICVSGLKINIIQNFVGSMAALLRIHAIKILSPNIVMYDFYIFFAAFRLMRLLDFFRWMLCNLVGKLREWANWYTSSRPEDVPVETSWKKRRCFFLYLLITTVTKSTWSLFVLHFYISFVYNK